MKPMPSLETYSVNCRLKQNKCKPIAMKAGIKEHLKIKSISTPSMYD